MYPSLTPRLRTVAALVPDGARLVDVGTDHAYLPAYLIAMGQIPSAIATDIRSGPLGRARATVEHYGLQERLQLRLCDGLAAVGADEVEAVTVAGMGGETILAILEQSPWAFDKVCVLQPMSAVEELRAGLDRLGVPISREVLSREKDTLYVTMLLEHETVRARRVLTPAEIYVGRRSTHAGDPLWPEYLSQNRRRAARALEGLGKSARPEDAKRRAYFEEILDGLDRMMKEEVSL